MDALPTTLPATLSIEQLEGSTSPLRIAVVTETYPPEVNGVALTLAKIVDGLRDRQHSLQLIRPTQPVVDSMRDADPDELLTAGMPIPCYPGLRMGLPAKRLLVRQWSTNRPDVVHIATEGPLGWSALHAARQLKLPISTDFRTNFHAYSSHYGPLGYTVPFWVICANFTTEPLAPPCRPERWRRSCLPGVSSGCMSSRGALIRSSFARHTAAWRCVSSGAQALMIWLSYMSVAWHQKRTSVWSLRPMRPWPVEAPA